MEQLSDKAAAKLNFLEVTQRLKEKVKRGNYTAEDLDEYFVISKVYLDRLYEDFVAGMDSIQAHLDKLTAMIEQTVRSMSTAHQQDGEVSQLKG